MPETQKISHETFDPDAHLDDVLSMLAAEGWTSFTPEASRKSLTAPGVQAMVTVSGSRVVWISQMQTYGVVGVGSGGGLSKKRSPKAAQRGWIS